MPYLRAKAQDYFEELGGGVSSDIMEEGLDTRQIQALTDQVFFSVASFDFKYLYFYRVIKVAYGVPSKLCILTPMQVLNFGSWYGTLPISSIKHHPIGPGLIGLESTSDDLEWKTSYVLFLVDFTCPR